MTSIAHPHSLQIPAGVAGVERIAAALRSLLPARRAAAAPAPVANTLLQQERAEAALARATLGIAVSNIRRYD